MTSAPLSVEYRCLTEWVFFSFIGSTFEGMICGQTKKLIFSSCECNNHLKICIVKYLSKTRIFASGPREAICSWKEGASEMKVLKVPYARLWRMEIYLVWRLGTPQDYSLKPLKWKILLGGWMALFFFSFFYGVRKFHSKKSYPYSFRVNILF